jgi:hypothetical protein
MDARASVRFGYSTDSASGDPLYAYKPSLAGSPWQFRLAPDALEWRAGVRSDRIPYGRIRRVRLSFRLAALQRRRFIAEIWSAAGPKVTIASWSWKGLADQERLDDGYAAFIAELHRRLGTTGSETSFEHGAPALLYWVRFAVSLAAGVAIAGLAVVALRSGALPAALFIGAFLGLFAWQTGTYFLGNRPGTYRPEALPADVLPR